MRLLAVLDRLADGGDAAVRSSSRSSERSSPSGSAAIEKARCLARPGCGAEAARVCAVRPFLVFCNSRPIVGSRAVPEALDDGELGERLAARTLELVDIPSESRDEAALAAHVAGVLRAGGVEVLDLGDTCVLARPRGHAPGRAARRPPRHRPRPGQPPRAPRRASACTASARAT